MVRKHKKVAKNKAKKKQVRRGKTIVVKKKSAVIYTQSLWKRLPVAVLQLMGHWSLQTHLWVAHIVAILQNTWQKSILLPLANAKKHINQKYQIIKLALKRKPKKANRQSKPVRKRPTKVVLPSSKHPKPR